MGDDAELCVDDLPCRYQTYALYNDRYQLLYSGPFATFTLPAVVGTYYLCVEVCWGSEEAYEGYRYFFGLEKE